MDESRLVIIRAGRSGGEDVLIISNDGVVNDTVFVKFILKRKQNQYIFLCKLDTVPYLYVLFDFSGSQ